MDKTNGDSVVLMSAWRAAHGLGLSLSPDGRAAPVVARGADGYDFEGSVVVPVVVPTGREAAINAAQLLRRDQLPLGDCFVHRQHRSPGTGGLHPADLIGKLASPANRPGKADLAVELAATNRADMRDGHASGGLVSGSDLGDHLFKRHLVVGEVADGLHLGGGDAVELPLRHSGGGDVEVGGHRSEATLFGFKPCGEVHAQSLVCSKPGCQGISKPDLFSIGLPMDAERRRRFIAAFNAKPFDGDRAKFMAKTKYTKGRVTQLFDEKEAFGQLAAARVAVRMGLPADAFERDDSSAGLSGRALDVARVFDKLSETEQSRFWRLLDAAMDEGVRGNSVFGDIEETKGRRAK